MIVPRPKESTPVLPVIDQAFAGPAGGSIEPPIGAGAPEAKSYHATTGQQKFALLQKGELDLSKVADARGWLAPRSQFCV